MVIPDYLASDVAAPTSDNQEPGNVSLLVAIGINGDAVVLSVTEGSETLIDDIRSLDAKMVLWPCPLPNKPGIYRFTGNLVLDGVGDDEHDLVSESIRNVSHQRIFLTTQLNVIR